MLDDRVGRVTLRPAARLLEAYELVGVVESARAVSIKNGGSGEGHVHAMELYVVWKVHDMVLARRARLMPGECDCEGFLGFLGVWAEQEPYSRVAYALCRERYEARRAPGAVLFQPLEASRSRETS